MNLNTIFMDFLVLGLAVLFFWKIKFYKSSYHTEYLSLQSGNMLRGLFALVVVFHHLAQRTTEGFLFHLFTHVGYLAVAVFFFFSGYGLQKKYITDETYSHQFLLRRLPSVLIPYIIMNFIYWLANAVNGTFYSLTDVLQTLGNGSPLVANSWYIICILFFYVVFYCLMRICKRHYIWMIAGACLYNLSWIIICHSLSYGTWWYKSSHLLVVGMIWATWDKKITEIIQKYYIIFTFIAWAAFLFLNYIKSSQIGLINGIILMAIAFDFVIIINLFSMKFCIGNRILNYLGAVSLEIYMIHGLFILRLKQYISNEFMFCTSVLICSIISAHILHKIFSFLLSKYKATLECVNIKIASKIIARETTEE